MSNKALLKQLETAYRIKCEECGDQSAHFLVDCLPEDTPKTYIEHCCDGIIRNLNFYHKANEYAHKYEIIEISIKPYTKENI